MNRTEIDALRRTLKDTKDAAAKLERQIDAAVRACQHEWGETSYDPDYQEAYTTPGDPPGTMGVDWRGPVHVPAKTTPRWKRECKKCGLVQTTQRKKKVGGPLAHEEPDFGD